VNVSVAVPERRGDPATGNRAGALGRKDCTYWLQNLAPLRKRGGKGTVHSPKRRHDGNPESKVSKRKMSDAEGPNAKHLEEAETQRYGNGYGGKKQRENGGGGRTAARAGRKISCPSDRGRGVRLFTQCTEKPQIGRGS